MPIVPWDIDNPGCTLWFEGWWHECCVVHDYFYADGGTAEERKAADFDLYYCVKAKGGPARTMCVAVRTTGWFFWRFRFKTRWGTLELKISQAHFKFRR